MLKLTQCMIVKNEEKNLQRALNWGKGVVDEQIVVDTGSTDGTAALAESLGAAVCRFDWTGDFSAARNYAISRCTGTWILFLDADEYFDESSIPLLRPLIEKINGQHLSDGGKKRRYNIIETPWVNKPGGADRQARIFRNIPYLRYTGAVHEKLHALQGGYLAVYAVKDAPAIIHTGYAWSEGNSSTSKGMRNFEAALKGLETSPASALLNLYAAEGLMNAGKYAKAEGFFLEAMQNADSSIPPDRLREGYRQWLSLYNAMLQATPGDPEVIYSASRACAQAVLDFPEEPDFDLLISRLYFAEKDLDGTIRHVSAAMAKKEPGKIAAQMRAADSDAFRKLIDACAEIAKG